MLTSHCPSFSEGQQLTGGEEKQNNTNIITLCLIT